MKLSAHARKCTTCTPAHLHECKTVRGRTFGKGMPVKYPTNRQSLWPPNLAKLKTYLDLWSLNCHWISWEHRIFHFLLIARRSPAALFPACAVVSLFHLCVQTILFPVCASWFAEPTQPNCRYWNKKKSYLKINSLGLFAGPNPTPFSLNHRFRE